MHPRQAVVASWSRVRAGSWGAAQSGLAAAGAWAFSTQVLGHTRPFFASVAAVVSLGLTAGGRLRRTADVAAGVALGVAVGDLWVSLFGQGVWQIGVVVFFALLLAIAINGAGLAVSQAAVQSVFVVALPRTPNSGFHRWQDAIVGGAAALLVAALLPHDPWKDVRRFRGRYLTELAEVLRETASAARTGDSAAAAEALGRGRLLEPVLTKWEQAIETGRETTRLSPLRRGDSRPQVALVRGLTRATRNLRVLVRRSMVALETGDPLPAEMPALLEELAEILAPDTSAADAIEPLIVFAAKLDPVRLRASSLSGQVVVAQLRVVVIDLLEGLGLDHDRAREALPSLTG
ncbi:MAG: hypothetical protein JWO12_601 [Frankiales bacterium]|nr:hypothetical protein [Frankiales bacterium]